MKKKIIIVFLFLSFFFIPINRSVIAQTSTPESTETKEESAWDNFWKGLWDFITSIGEGIAGVFVSNVEIIPCQGEKKFTDYNNTDVNTNYRAQSASSQKYRRGSYLKAIIDGTYEDKTISYLCDGICSNSKTNDNCLEIKYSTLVYYFYKKGEKKILYDRDNPKEPVDYDSEKMDGYDYTIPANSDAYFEKLYNQISQIPQGAYQGEEDTAAASSNELNGSTRYIVPASSQTDKSPTGDGADDVEQRTKDNETNQRKFYANVIPAKSQTVLGTSTDSDSQVLGVSTDTDTLKTQFTNYLHPASWQNNQVLIEESDDDAKKTSRGLSQYGAIGMALSNISYEEILKNYYGDIKLADIKDYVSNPNNINITVNTRSDDSDKNMRNKTITLDLEKKYLLGIDEIQDYIGKKDNGIELLKAQAIISRTFAFVRTNGFTQNIKATHDDQKFTYGKIGKLPYLSKAVEETAGKIIVDANTNQPFETEFKSKFCGSSSSYQPKSIPGRGSNHTNPSYTSNKSYEEIAYQKLYNKSIDSICK